jgi:hypothetical protein
VYVPIRCITRGCLLWVDPHVHGGCEDAPPRSLRRRRSMHSFTLHGGCEDAPPKSLRRRRSMHSLTLHGGCEDAPPKSLRRRRSMHALTLHGGCEDAPPRSLRRRRSMHACTKRATCFALGQRPKARQIALVHAHGDELLLQQLHTTFEKIVCKCCKRNSPQSRSYASISLLDMRRSCSTNRAGN